MKQIPTKEDLLVELSICAKNGYDALIKEKMNDLLLFYPEHYAKVKAAQKGWSPSDKQESVSKGVDPVDIALGVGAGIIGAEIIENIFD